MFLLVLSAERIQKKKKILDFINFICAAEENTRQLRLIAVAPAYDLGYLRRVEEYEYMNIYHDFVAYLITLSHLRRLRIIG